MAKGSATLGRIDREIAALRSEEAGLAARVGEVGDRLAALRGEEIEAYRELARFRLDAEGGARVGGTLDRAEAMARRLMAERKAALEDLAARLAEAAAVAQRLEEERGRLSAQISARHGEIDEADAALIERLAATDDYKARIDAVEAAGRVAGEAERKAELAARDRVEKGEPYEADPLFLYLWSRGFGTAGYRGRGLVRMLDRWVARLVRYQDARPNYHMLLEIPTRLGEHAARTRAAAEAAAAALDAHEAEQRRAAGILDLEAAAGELEARLAAVGTELGTAEASRADLESRRSAMIRGEDETSQAAVKSLVAALRDESLPELRRAALLTPDPTDERIVERLERLDDAIADFQEELDRRLGLQKDIEKKRVALEEARGRFIGESYDDDRWEFDKDTVEDILKALLRGAIDGAVLWKGLRRAGRYTPPRRPSGSSAGTGGPVFRPPSGRPGGLGRPSGGGFRTGGTFGRGGGFRTGGRF